MRSAADVAHGLAASPDPVIAYQALVRLLGVLPDAPAAASRAAAIRTSPRVRALLSGRLPDGRSPLHAYAKWQGPHWTLVLLALVDHPAPAPELLPLKRQVDAWLLGPAHDRPPQTVRVPGQPERVRRCASQEGNAIWAALRLGLADEVTDRLAERLIELQWPDGGWNCDRRPEARTSSVIETALPARALGAYARARAHAGAGAATDRAAEFLLARRLLWRRADGRLIGPTWGGPIDRIHFPIQFHDVLFALQVMAELGRLADPGCEPAMELLRAKRLPDGTFPCEYRMATTRPVAGSRATYAEWGSAGRRTGNPFVTILALDLLRQAARARTVEDLPG